MVGGAEDRCMEACHSASLNASYLASHKPKSACFSPLDPAGTRINILKAVVTIVPRDSFGSCHCYSYIFVRAIDAASVPQIKSFTEKIKTACEIQYFVRGCYFQGVGNPTRHLIIQRKWRRERSFCGGSHETCWLLPHHIESRFYPLFSAKVGYSLSVSIFCEIICLIKLLENEVRMKKLPLYEYLSGPVFYLQLTSIRICMTRQPHGTLVL
jgi:hypothetical protein